MNNACPLAVRKIHYFDSVSSTNEVARRLAADGAERGEVVLAEWQTAGKGRRGATWHCPKGKGILASVILRPGKATPQVPLLSLAAALAVAEAIHATTGLPARTKWPNDVLIRGKKVAGILVESSVASAERSLAHTFRSAETGAGLKPCARLRPAGLYAIVGIGVNVNFHLGELFSGSDACAGASEARLADALSQPATTILDELGKEVDRLALLTRIVERLEENADLIAGGLGAQDFEPLLAAWRRADAYMGKAVEIRIGDELLQGIYEDVAEDGSLILLAPDGQRHRLNAGEVRGVEGSELRVKGLPFNTQGCRRGA